MPPPRTFFVTCPCSKHVKVPININVEECPVEEEVHIVTEACPHSFETWCHKHVNVPLPPGLKPADDDVTHRHD